MKYTLNIPDTLLGRLRDEHARTYAQHRQAFGPWLCSIWATAIIREEPPK